MPRFAVILPAAGRSSRFGSAEKKVFAVLDGRPVWLRSAELFVARPDVCQCIVVAAPEDRGRFGEAPADGRVEIAEGGSERFESVANALARTTAEAEFVAVHDAARPCLTPALIDKVFARAAETGAAMLAVPVADTVKRDDGRGRVVATVPRRGYGWRKRRRCSGATGCSTPTPVAPPLGPESPTTPSSSKRPGARFFSLRGPARI